MRAKIQAGADIDFATPKEVRDEIASALQSWFVEVSRGDRFARFAFYGDVSAGGAVTIGKNNEQLTGPSEGFVWSVRRIAFNSVYSPSGGNSLNLYLNSNDVPSLVYPSMPTYVGFENQLILYPGDTLVIDGTAAANGRLWVVGQVREIPLPLAWRL